MSNNYKLLGIESVEPYKLAGSIDLYRIEPPPMLIDGILPRGSVTGLTAVPGCGKTWLTLDMMRAVATGGKFLQHFQAEQAGVLFVGSDASIYDYAQQWKRLTVKEWAELNPDEETSPEYENPLDSNVRFLIQSDFTFDSLDHVKRVIATARNFEWGPMEARDEYDWTTGEYGVHMRREIGFGLIIFDTYSKMTTGNQNDNSVVENAFRNIRLISETTGAAMVLLHHNANPTEYNDGENWRGATAASGALDNRIQLVASKIDPYRITLKYKKFRGITPEPFDYMMNVDQESEASLVYTETAAEGTQSFDDGVLEAAIKFLNKDGNRGVQFTLKQLAAPIYPELAHVYPDLNKFHRRLRSQLTNETRKHSPRVMIEGGGKTNRLAFYTGVMKSDFKATSNETRSGTRIMSFEDYVREDAESTGV